MDLPALSMKFQFFCVGRDKYHVGRDNYHFVLIETNFKITIDPLYFRYQDKY